MKLGNKKYLSLLVIFLLAGCHSNKPATLSSEEISSSNSSEEISSEEISSEEVLLPAIKNLLPLEGTYSRLTDYQKAYFEKEDYSDTTPFSGNLNREDISYPVPIDMSWEIENMECDKYSIDIYKINNEELQFVCNHVTDTNNLKFYNTEVGVSYKYKVTALDENDQVIVESDYSEVISTANEGPRHLYVNGVSNMRDLGGYGKIKQGMIYRSGRFNEDKASAPKITVSEEGVKELERLGIKTEIDLRRTANNEVGGLSDTSVIASIDNYYQFPMLFEGKNLLTYVGPSNSSDGYNYDNPAAIKSVFEVLADENNYPVVFHCSIGKDRTGCIAYLLEGLLGFDQETMYRDYMFTNFSDAGFCKLKEDILDRYGKTLEDYENGSTINEKIYNYLNEVIGLSEEKLNTIINILGA